MRRDLPAMAEKPLELLIVGGGVIGAAAAWDAARRGLRVGLVEARDFGAGTTGATTRLAHGGLRYLEHLDVAQVREGVRERAWLLRAAPHLVRPLSFLLPQGKGHPLRAAKMRAGLAAYDLLAGRGWPRRSRLSGARAIEEEPSLRPASAASASLFFDAQVLFPERLVVEFALAAAERGAHVANHAPVTALTPASGGWRADVHDDLADRAFELRARCVLNCAGPWVGRLAGLAGVRRELARTTRGSHVAFPNFLRRAVVLRADDGRTFFAVPWNEVTLIGTTDIDDARNPAEVAASSEEVAYLLREAGAFLDLDGQQPCYTTAGVRALLRVEGGSPSRVPRGHVIVDHARDGLEGLFSVVGGKMTTARAVAEDAVNAAGNHLGRGREPPGQAALPGAGGTEVSVPADGPLAILGARAAGAIGPAICDRHATKGTVRLAVEQEQCASLADFMLRRSLAGHAPDLGAHCAPAIARALGDLLGWDAREGEAQFATWEQQQAQRRRGLR